jgi:hypothetical protein
LETFPAKDRTPLGWPERNCCFPSALGANSGSFNASGRPTAFGRAILPFYFTRLTALRLIPEILLVIKLLFTRGKDKVRSAIHTL